MRGFLSLIGCVFIALSLLVAPGRASGCAVTWPRGVGKVTIATESALIIWDEKTKTQHFIRRASFDTTVANFGFLVPTPTPPQLAEAPDELFKQLEEWTRAEKKTTIVFEDPTVCCCCCFPTASGTTMKGGGVQVLAVAEVAGYDAKVLQADDPAALRAWLEKNGYDARPELTKWLEPYVKAGWVITAFKITKADAKQDQLSTQAVRMSFKTDKPFFPYREPVESAGSALDGSSQRLLRIFLLSSQRMQGTRGEVMDWQGKAVWANPLSAEQRQALTAHLDARQTPVPEDAWLTVFDDESSIRPGNADIFFSRSLDQSTLQREPIYEYTVIPAALTYGTPCLIVMGAIMVWALGRWWRRRSRSAPTGGTLA